MAEREYPAAFDIESCRDVLQKLERELERLKTADRRYDQADHAFNFAVTAWHLIDWILRDLEEDQEAKSRVAAVVGVQPADLDGTRFREFLRSNRGCPTLKFCRIIANGSKHFHITYDDPAVSVAVSASDPSLHGRLEEFPPEVDPLEYASIGWTLKIIVGEEQLRAVEVFEKVLSFWTHFIFDNEIGN